MRIHLLRLQWQRKRPGSHSPQVDGAAVAAAAVDDVVAAVECVAAAAAAVGSALLSAWRAVVEMKDLDYWPLRPTATEKLKLLRWRKGEKSAKIRAQNFSARNNISLQM